MKEINERLLRTKETADVLGVKVCTVLLLERRGLLPAVRDWAGQRRFLQGDVEKFRKQLMVGEMARVEA